MPNETEMLEHILGRAKDRKSYKKCKENKCNEPANPCNVECCVADCNPECCTPGFQRLDKLRVNWEFLQQNLVNVRANVNTRASTAVTVPSFETLIPQSASGTLTWGLLERGAFAFVNSVRYLNFEECGKLDQVTGWSVDVQTGNLYFYQDLPELGLTTSDSRSALLSTNASSFTPQIKQKLSAMEPFWKLSLKAINRVNENPKTEGNICEIKDKCGNRFLVAINRVDSQQTQSTCTYNSRYSIVVVKLC